MMRALRGLGSALLLGALLAGVPALMVQIGRWPQLGWRDLLRPDDGSLLLGALTAGAWAAWLVIAVLVLVEIVNAVAGLRIRLPGVAGPQRWVAGLVLSVAALIGSNHPAQAAPPPAAPAAPAAPAGEAGQAADRDERAAPQTSRWATHRVQRGDTLWDLAERYYGDGMAWQRIRDANADLIDDPDELEIGWRLVLPGVTAEADGNDGRPADRGQQEDADRRGASGERSEPAAQPRRPISDPGAGPASRRAAEPAGRPTPVGEPAAEAALAGVPAPELARAGAPAAGVAVGASALLAAGVVGTVALRRARQLAERAPGRRLADPGAAARRVEAALGQRQRPNLLRRVDAAVREATATLGAGSRVGLDRVLVAGPAAAEDRAGAITMIFDAPPGPPPPGWLADGSAWQCPAGHEPSPAPRQPTRWPALACIGWVSDGSMLMVDLESRPLLNLGAARRDASGAEVAEDFRAALMLELTCAPWSEQARVIMIGGDTDFVTALGEPHAAAASDLAEVTPWLRRLIMERRAAGGGIAQRADPDRADAWQPVVLLFARPLGARGLGELRELLADARGLGVSAVCLGEPDEPLVDVGGRPADWFGTDFAPQLIDRSVRAGVTALLAASRDPAADRAWWWADDTAAPDRHTTAPDRHDTESAGARITWLRPPGDRAQDHSASSTPSQEASAVNDPPAHSSSPAAPVVGLLGPVRLTGTTGVPPSRAGRQCVEYAAWLLEHPGATGQEMAAGLLVAEGTRRSNMSRLRLWLGHDADGRAYLPEAYSGRIELHPDVTSDWLRLQALLVIGVNRAADGALRAALELVRGAPLADAAPGQWTWAEELRTDMCSMIRDAAHVLAERALAGGDHATARWACERGLLAAEEDERLLCLRLQIEHDTGNALDAERLALRMTRHARALGVDLSDDTVAVIQRVLEGRPRRRA